MDEPEDSLPAPFSVRETSMDDIRAAGWYVEHSASGNWWFRMNPNTGSSSRQPVPFWIRQMVADAYESGQERVRAEMRHTLGITAKQGKRCPVQMFPAVP